MDMCRLKGMVTLEEKDATEHMGDVVQSIVGMMGQYINACDLSEVRAVLEDDEPLRAFVGIGEVTAPSGKERARAAALAALESLKMNIANNR